MEGSVTSCTSDSGCRRHARGEEMALLCAELKSSRKAGYKIYDRQANRLPAPMNVFGFSLASCIVKSGPCSET